MCFGVFKVSQIHSITSSREWCPDGLPCVPAAHSPIGTPPLDGSGETFAMHDAAAAAMRSTRRKGPRRYRTAFGLPGCSSAPPARQLSATVAGTSCCDSIRRVSLAANASAGSQDWTKRRIASHASTQLPGLLKSVALQVNCIDSSEVIIRASVAKEARVRENWRVWQASVAGGRVSQSVNQSVAAGKILTQTHSFRTRVHRRASP